MTFKETAHDIDVSPETDSYETKVDLDSTNTLHELLALAIGDFAQVIANPRYSINLNTWHEPLDNGKCSVCLAGSVMAMHLGTDPAAYSTPKLSYWTPSPGEPREDALARRLMALNSLRQGAIGAAQSLLGRDTWHPHVETLSRKWHHKVRCSNARTRLQARLLLADLKLLQRDLAEAGL